MKDLVLHSTTQRQIEAFMRTPQQAVILSGPTGSGKRRVGLQLGAALLSIDEARFQSYAYSRLIAPEEGKGLGIETIRELDHFLALKVPQPQAINRVVLIDNSETLTREAQNALLKTLEEPPTGTVIILTTAHEQALLPTIRSRAQTIAIKRPLLADLRAYFQGQNYETGAIDRAIALSDGLPGLTQSVLENSEHHLLVAAKKARELLAQTAYERLIQVDALSRERGSFQDILTVIHRMAAISLRQSDTRLQKRWLAISQAVYEAEEGLLTSAQLKLVICNFMLKLDA